MSRVVMDEYEIRKLPHGERLDKCISILQNNDDESYRWDAVWLAGEIAEAVGPNDPLFKKVADLMVWILENDDNGVVKHEACFQIAARNMRNKIPNLVDAALNNKSILTRHEAIEALGLMRAVDSENMIRNALHDPNYDVKETATFVLKRLKRLKNKGEFKPTNIL